MTYPVQPHLASPERQPELSPLCASSSCQLHRFLIHCDLDCKQPSPWILYRDRMPDTADFLSGAALLSKEGTNPTHPSTSNRDARKLEYRARNASYVSPKSPQTSIRRILTRVASATAPTSASDATTNTLTLRSTTKAPISSAARSVRRLSRSQRSESWLGASKPIRSSTARSLIETGSYKHKC
jgi:hypothetical protein